ncbi:hypothetical protein [Winogradskyella luteola]|uniref:Uncharacterized protein n=1 Tax=Winogradskyella luteola TaxID=2828330 RepID=A0A9X1F6B4_9FLAO|nr:hypothetical protein [Winogradskyella luteola]MBV7267936.1 hypothetical protein [Winogradskyella luteola]
MHSQKGFRYAMISLILSIVALFVTIVSIRFELDIFSLVAGFIVILIGFISLFGFIASLKGIKEKNTNKKVLGLIINSVFLLGFVFIIVANIYDIYSALN